MGSELKPCPFCGGTNAYIASNCYGQHYARCPECGAVVWGNDKEDIRSKKEIVKLWNRRAEDGNE